MFDPRDPYDRFYWHYESRQPLSVAQIIALGSVDPKTVALVWLLLEQGASLTVAGPTDPQPGVGKTTTLNALLQFLPADSALAYMSGMYETFGFMSQKDIPVEQIYAVCNEVSDHLPIYMWGRVARYYLRLPKKGYHIATSVHADTIDDVVQLYRDDVGIAPEEVRRLGLIVNIGLTGNTYPPKRRWLSTHFIAPETSEAEPEKITPLALSRWLPGSDRFEHADHATLATLAGWAHLSVEELQVAWHEREACLLTLVNSGHAGELDEVYEAVERFRTAKEA